MLDQSKYYQDLKDNGWTITKNSNSTTCTKPLPKRIEEEMKEASLSSQKIFSGFLGWLWGYLI